MEKLEKLLDMDDDFKKVDILTLVGTLTKEEKAEYIRLFVNGSSKENCSLDMRVLCATSGVGNAGIDSPDVRSVYRIDFPPSILDKVVPVVVLALYHRIIHITFVSPLNLCYFS